MKVPTTYQKEIDKYKIDLKHDNTINYRVSAMHLLSVADFAAISMREPTWSTFTDQAIANGTDIKGNMPFGYVVHLVQTGEVDLKGAIKIGDFRRYDGFRYTYHQNNDVPDCLSLIATNGNERYVIGNISYNGFTQLPSMNSPFG